MDEQEYIAQAKQSLSQRLGVSVGEIICQSWQRELVGRTPTQRLYRYYFFLRHQAAAYQFRAESGAVHFMMQIPA